MALIRLITGLHCIAIIILLCLAESVVNNNRDDLIQDSVRRLLGVKSGTERTAFSGKMQSLPYIMDLYEKYRSGQTPMQGNTVRSILAIKDTIGEVDMLIFNLTGISAKEQILQSKLYLLKRRKPKPGKKREASSFRLKIGCLPNMTSHRYIEISLTRQKPEWHSYDISESVVSCKQSKKQGDHLLGLILQVKRSKGVHRLSSFKRLVKQNSQPFLLIFSEDNQNQTHSAPKSAVYDEIGRLLRAKADEEGTLPEMIHSEITRKKRSIYFESYITSLSPGQFSTGQSHFRLLTGELGLKNVNNTTSYEPNFNSDLLNVLRDVIDKTRYTLSVNTLNASLTDMLQDHNRDTNEDKFQRRASHMNLSTRTEVPSKVLFLEPEPGRERLREPMGIIQAVSIGQSGEVVQSETELLRTRRSVSSAMHYSTMTKETGSKNMDPTINTLQVVEEKYVHKSNSGTVLKTRRPNRYKSTSRPIRRQRKKKRRRNRKLPFWWTKHDNKLHAQDASKLCKRKSLLVDFSQMGWDDWIISPKSFNAHYCSGGCTFPLIKDAKPSNHAAIQSLVHAIGLNPNVPTPCCVPSVTSSLTLLYFDESGSLVLKNYPNMIVEKCACR